MTEQLLQVGRFTLRKLSPDERRAQAVPINKHQRKEFDLKVCKNPRSKIGDCRALTNNGERCKRGRQIDNFFCPQHDPTDRLLETPPSIAKVKEFLGKLGFKGDVYRLKEEYMLSFTSVRCIFRGKTGITHTAFGTLAKWMHAWMKLEDRAYLPASCHHCQKEFRFIDGKGMLCDCDVPVCNDCILEHRGSLEHLTAPVVMDAAKETHSSLEKKVKENLIFLAGADLINVNDVKGEYGTLPTYWDVRQKFKAILVWTQGLVSDKLTEGGGDGTQP